MVVLLCTVFFSVSDTEVVYAYGESGYYAQGSYYGQSSYVSYTQGSYYTQGTYYSESTYGTVTLDGNIKFAADLLVVSTISKGSGTFVIDHPLDPVNRLLYHSFVESPDVKNIYNGIAEITENGEAVVKLPDYFEALNDNFRYQVKSIGAAQPQLHIKEGVLNNEFIIGGGVPGAEVSWQVTGIRHDPYIIANPVVVEVLKSATALVDRGQYLFADYKQYYDQ